MKKSNVFLKNVFERRELVNFQGRDIWIITKEDLIISKFLWAKESFSEKQLTDIKNLMKSGFDAAYVEKWTEDQGVYKLLEQCREEIEE